jgi:hypothetical protein
LVDESTVDDVVDEEREDEVEEADQEDLGRDAADGRVSGRRSHLQQYGYK